MLYVPVVFAFPSKTVETNEGFLSFSILCSDCGELSHLGDVLSSSLSDEILLDIAFKDYSNGQFYRIPLCIGELRSYLKEKGWSRGRRSKESRDISLIRDIVKDYKVKRIVPSDNNQSAKGGAK
jgi:hypothetical protein